MTAATTSSSKSSSFFNVDLHHYLNRVSKASRYEM
jgi:hypothetical protein